MNLLIRAPLCVAAFTALPVASAFSPVHTAWRSNKLSLRVDTAVTPTRLTHLPVVAMSQVESESESSVDFDAVVAVDEDEDADADDGEPKPECASLLPGQVVSIRIGDTSLARKAWKKRRRSGSPILVPCTIMGMNRDLMVKYNLINLLHRFGKSSKGNNSGVVLTVGAIVKLYKYRFGGDLLQHAKALGSGTIVAYLRSVFDEATEQESGVRVIRTGPKNELALASSLSIRLARESAFKAEFVQFVTSSADTKDNQMVHSGTTFQIANHEEKYQTISTLDSSTIQPLSAAVRISQADEIANRLTTGMECNAFVHSYDINGDNGSPLLICSIDPPRNLIRNQVKKKAYIRRQKSRSNDDFKLMKVLDGEAITDLKDLNVGDGPFQGTIVRVSERTGAAFVDLGVSRQNGKKNGGGKARILGMLRFEDVSATDVVVDDGVEQLSSSEASAQEAAIIEASILEGSEKGSELTIEDDVTEIYSFDDDGTVTMIDPITKEVTVIGSIDDDEDIEDEDDDDDFNMFEGMSPEERLSAIGNMLDEEIQIVENQKDNADKKSLQVGEELEVYVRAVFPQSGRFMVTTDKNIKGHKAKDLKQEKEAEKRLERLGEKGLETILESVGKEIEGEIKANSKSGDWYYVQPLSDDGFPVGIGASDVEGVFSSGDKVQIRIEGIDYSRGQLALKIIKKL